MANDGLWATRLAINIATAILGSVEDAVALIMDANETMARERRERTPIHVRTGEYHKDRRIAALHRERPAPETLCGELSSQDVGMTQAQQIIREASEPFLSRMCPACRAKLEGAGVRNLSHLPGRAGTASPKQVNYLRSLVREAFSNRYATNLDARHLDRLSVREASSYIDTLKRAKDNGWK